MTAGVNHSVTLADGSNLVTVLPIALPPAPGTLVVSRETPALVSEVLQDGEGFSLAIIQQLHDRAAMRSAEDRTTLSRAIVLEEGAELGAGNFNLGGSGLSNVAPGTVPTDAATVGQLLDLIIASGNVPVPLAEDVGKALVALAGGLFAWGQLDKAALVDGILSADAAGLAKMADGFLSASPAARLKMATGFFAADAASRAKFAAGFLGLDADSLAIFADGFFAASAAARLKMADGFIVPAKLSSDPADISGFRSLLGQSSVKVFDQTLSAAATGFIVPLTGFKAFRGRLLVVPNPAAADFSVGYRTSFDGTSYAAGASDYIVQYLGSVGGSAFAGSGATPQAALTQAVESTQPGTPTRAYFDFDAGSAGEKANCTSISFGLNSSGNADLSMLGTWRDAVGLVSHLSVLATVANGLGTGTRLIVEGVVQ
ncbi:MAG: hypothetical protein J0I54_17665 [Bosea sp.]|uniref:hypothetical protein n=1 Tax=unclassified Bosea (in: a-proteobacteria) TaxID=2653178 RepID=UPI001AC2E221|nr:MULTISPECIES: hypothetical protein [unclassified Bosea (in: a-proteobacteria)]MBN9458461.1 hypothetical protein [Bosea sp. (in: a-proteobacteria)]